MEFLLLGPLEVVDAGRPVRIRGLKERSVLALLLLARGRVVSVSHLLDSIWENEPASGRKSLQVRVAGLRKVLGADRIVSSPSGYRLRVELGEFDLDRFEALSAEGGAENLRAALELWRGAALVEFGDAAWATAPALRLEELRLAALERRIDAELEAGRHRELAAELDLLVAEHPLRERFWAQRMLALYRAGRQGEALETYRSARRRLVEELGVEPGRALQELERAILTHARSLEVAEPSVGGQAMIVGAFSEEKLDRLQAVAEALACDSERGVVLLRPVRLRDELQAASTAVNLRRQGLIEAGVDARASAFVSRAPGRELARFATEQGVDLVLVDGSPELLEDPDLVDLLVAAPCDVAVLVGGVIGDGPVLVPFTGADHDWSAVEVAALLSRGGQRGLLLAGPTDGKRDASRLLARASLAVQRALRVTTESIVVPPGPEGLVREAERAGAVVVGLSDHWRVDGVGATRAALAARSPVAVLLIRQGLRPGGLAPADGYTRFTWSLRPTS
jgi:DNA-binding SARP family transcriptional activator